MVLQFTEENKDEYKPRKGAKGRRPVEITDQMIKEVEVLAGRGLTQKQIADYFGISRNTFYHLTGRTPDLRIALTKGKSKTISFVAGKLIEQIKLGDVRSMIFYLKTQAGWRHADSNSSDYDEERDEENKKNKLELGTRDPNEASKTYQQIMLKGKK